MRLYFGNSHRLSAVARNLDSFGNRLTQYGNVSHLSRGPRSLLSVQVEMDVGVTKGGVPLWRAVIPDVSQQIRHRCRSDLPRLNERQIADRAQLLFKLAALKALDRQMARVVWARCNLIDQQFALSCDEKLNAEQALDVKNSRPSLGKSLARPNQTPEGPEMPDIASHPKCDSHASFRKGGTKPCLRECCER